MNRWYYREFDGCAPLTINQKTNWVVGDLINPQNKYVLKQHEVNFYNQFTIELNDLTFRADQEFILDRRFRFFSEAGMTVN